MAIFDVVIIERGVCEEVIYYAPAQVAKDAESAKVQALMSLTDEQKQKICKERVEVLVRPFC